MKKALLIALLFTLMLTMAFAMDVEIGNGTTTTNYVPLYGYYEHSWSSYILTSDQIGRAIEINKLQFNVGNTPSAYQTANQKVYMKQTSQTQLTTAYPNPESNGFTLVYNGSVTWNGGGWQGIDLSTEFSYDGSSNLQIVWENHSGSWASGYPNFLKTNTAGNNTAVYKYADTTFPAVSGTLVQYFPNTRLGYTAENEPTVATYVAPANNAMNVPITTNLQWTMGQNTTHVDVYFSSSSSDVVNMEASALVVNDQNVTSYQDNNLSTLTDYYWRVISRNRANGIAVNGPVWKFSTEAGEGIFAVGVGDGTASGFQYPWNFYYGNSVAETIYLAEELNIGGLLTTVSFFNSFASNIPGKQVSMWIGETTQPDLTNYIPSSQLTAVFSGLVDFPAGQNTITIELDTPYSYGGGNLVVLTDRPLDAQYYSSSDKFYHTVTTLANRTLSWQSDTVDFDPANMTASPTRTVNMPNAVFYFDVSGLGSVAGTVTDGTNPLGGVDISIANTNYHTVTLPDGSFEFPYVAEGNGYTITASKHGYNDATATFNVVENEETVVNITMSLLPVVEVSGQVKTNDTSQGIQAHVTLEGYQDYEVDTDANGNFVIPNVFSNHTYTGKATAANYQPAIFTAVVGETNLVVSNIVVTETLYPASGVVAELVGNEPVITWVAPASGGGVPSTESFETGFPPADWATIVNNTTQSWARYETLPFDPPVSPTDGAYQVGCKFDYALQNEWLITKEMNCPTGNLTFDFYGHEGSTNGDNYYVKVTLDGGTTWTPLWNASDFPDADNHYDRPIVININDYAGQNVKFAWNFVDGDGGGLWYSCFIDNIYFGGTRMDSRELVAVSKSDYKATNQNTSLMSSKRDPNEVSKRVKPVQTQIINSTIRNNDRAFVGYNVYRFLVEDQTNQANWTRLTGRPTNLLTYTDIGWTTLVPGFYKYAVKAVYTGGYEAKASVSNWLQYSSIATVTVNVDSNLGGPLSNANIVLIGQTANPGGGHDSYQGTTNAFGVATFEVNKGMYNVTITATGFDSYTGEVNATSDVTVNATLEELSFPPSAVVAEIVGDNAVVTWNAPDGSAHGNWLTKGSEENVNNIGTGGAASIYVSHMYTEAELAGYQGMYINSIKFFPNVATATYTVKVWGDVEGTLELYSQTVPTIINAAWNEVPLTSSVAIPTSGPVYIGYHVDTPSGHPCGCGAGPVVPGGDLIKLGEQDEWDSMFAAYDLDYNWNIQALVSWMRGARVATDSRRIIQKQNSQSQQIMANAKLELGNSTPMANNYVNYSRAVLSYNVYRFLAEEQSNFANWDLLEEETLALTYTDTDWSIIDSGFYRYAVKAVYTYGESGPVISNMLLKNMNGSVDGTVKDEYNAPINGAIVHLDGGTATTDASGYFLFAEVLRGDYAITATAAGHMNSTTQNITVVATETTTVDFSLIISNIIISDSFEEYPDFALEAAPWVMYDGDLSNIYTIQDVTYPNQTERMAYIIFNPAMTTPPLSAAYAAHIGDKYAASMAAMNGPNDDWMMTEPFTLGNIGRFNFWAKSITTDYGLERFNVLVSTGSTDPFDFVSISGPTYTEAPVPWTHYSYSLDAYANQTIRVAIQCVSDDAFMFMVDDVEIDAPGGFIPNPVVSVPATPENVTITMSGNNAIIVWDAVTMDIDGNPLTPDYYQVYYNDQDTQDDTFVALDTTTNLTYTHTGVGLIGNRVFYRVKACMNDGSPVLSNVPSLINQKQKVKQTDVKRTMTKHR